MGRPRLNKHTREELLEQGMAAFLEHGFHGTGIKEVLDAVKVPKGSFYNYFESKEAFGAEAIRYYAECFAGKMREALTEAPDAIFGLRRFFERLMTEFEELDYKGGCLVANLGGELEGSDICRQALADVMRGWCDALAGVLSTAQQEGTVRTDIEANELAQMLVDTWEGAVIRMKIERSLEPLRKCVARLLDDYFRP